MSDIEVPKERDWGLAYTLDSCFLASLSQECRPDPSVLIL